ncbi:hypothetical protein QE152_g802 [Popillia japonica]|uniref:Apoptosis-resistant E3 ubiquitin protein ligase 1 PH-like domain-containing protein n=1 Tax=Popillia japonica TaxID=7064 RepID=A0AAW1NCQ0_POPJA
MVLASSSAVASQHFALIHLLQPILRYYILKKVYQIKRHVIQQEQRKEMEESLIRKVYQIKRHVIQQEQRKEMEESHGVKNNKNLQEVKEPKVVALDYDWLSRSQESNSDIIEENYSVALDYDWQTRRITVQLQFLYEGGYHAKMRYQGTELNNGDFDIIVLNSADSTLVHNNVASKNHNVCYEAKLIGVNSEKILKPKKILCYVSPKQLIIKELILKFIPKRIYTFRLCPSTKINFISESMAKQNENLYGSFVIDDGCQPKIELVSKERDVIAATFAQFLLKNMGGSETFKYKQDFFYQEIRKYHQKHYHKILSMKVNREKLLESSMKAFRF